MIATFPDYGGGDPRPALSAFLDGFRTVMDDIAENASTHEQAFPPDIAALIPPAWRDLSSRYEDLLRSVDRLQEPTISQHGLVGPQLALKLALVRARNTPFRGAATYLAGGLLDWLIKLLKSIDVLLKSLIKALNADSAWEELKEAIENALDNLR
ncbi:hypothetical protein ACLF3G_18695 [Falsiroseomonas sp. HC035]|uniref:hypothetical protein n=1 Tax=Falsiroseomonas sp. HC035 TaxID=3390999 RepID=UPI003D321CE4